MSLSVYLSIAWVLSSTAVAMLPMRMQYVPGVALLIAAPGVIGFLGVQHGWLAAAGAVAAFVSMFRNPLRHFWRKYRGLPTGLEPKEKQS